MRKQNCYNVKWGYRSCSEREKTAWLQSIPRHFLQGENTLLFHPFQVVRWLGKQLLTSIGCGLKHPTKLCDRRNVTGPCGGAPPQGPAEVVLACSRTGRLPPSDEPYMEEAVGC
ncbi:hypothetical protein HNY73_018116 [Argiope bruennichi]|uniref:Uncharacterized protein n=1 Tax=Argiope bruennichi TaxID=94029 RepID=A0A8T0ED86_ARGBR|nr:hypothetical protein HNY73_018116 [Argiope bruennichi]